MPFGCSLRKLKTIWTGRLKSTDCREADARGGRLQLLHKLNRKVLQPLRGKGLNSFHSYFRSQKYLCEAGNVAFHELVGNSLKIPLYDFPMKTSKFYGDGPICNLRFRSPAGYFSGFRLIETEQIIVEAISTDCIINSKECLRFTESARQSFESISGLASRELDSPRIPRFMVTTLKHSPGWFPCCTTELQMIRMPCSKYFCARCCSPLRSAGHPIQKIASGR
jgi:hypothetical protein